MTRIVLLEPDRARRENLKTLLRKHCGPKNNKATFTVRKVAQGYGVERIFPLHSPRIESIKVLKVGRVRRAKLYYLRERRGKAARIKERMIHRG